MDTLIPLVNSLALAIALIGLIIGLCLAPWQILLLLLVLGLIATKRLMPPSSSPIATPDLETDPSKPSVRTSQPSSSKTLVKEPSSPSQPTSTASVMVYRGTRYKLPQKSEAVVEAPTVEQTGKYRGTVCKINSRQPRPSTESNDLN